MNNHALEYNFNHFKVVRFKSMLNWAVSSSIGENVNYKKDLQLFRISSLLRRNRDTVKIDDQIKYRRVTIRLYGKGVLQRDEVFGSSIGTKSQFIVSKGQFIMSKIDARNGAFGIIPESLDGAIVTQDFLSYNINKKIVLPDFFLLLTTTKQFHDLCQRASSGTTGRQRIDEKSFLNFEFPIPPLDTQEIIIKKWKEQERLVSKYQSEIEGILKDIDSYFNNEFQINVESNIRKQHLYFVSFSSLKRWDFWNVKTSSIAGNVVAESFRTIVLGKPQYGANSKAIQKITDVRYIRITDINEDGGLNDTVVSANEVDSQYLLKENDFLIARSGNTVGKTFLYKEKYGKCIFAGYLIRYKLDTERVIPEYVLEYTKSSLFKKWIESNQRVSAQPNINGQEYLNFPIFVPSKEIQMRIVTFIKNSRDRVNQLSNEIRELKLASLQEFETAIF